MLCEDLGNALAACWAMTVGVTGPAALFVLVLGVAELIYRRAF